jgi:uncharacterized protein YhaN
MGERRRFESGSGSELASFERESAAAQMAEAARDWTVLKLASTMLSRAIERYRETQSNPTLRRAGSLFSTLTGGSFAGIAQAFDEEDRAHLIGQRPSGEQVSVAEAMSEGTRDQLFLALRLAYLEDYALGSEPMPFIGDDLFQTFDDARTAAGLRTLAETSERFQTILFTHHRSVVEIAEAELGTELDLLEL